MCVFEALDLSERGAHEVLLRLGDDDENAYEIRKSQSY